MKHAKLYIEKSIHTYNVTTYKWLHFQLIDNIEKNQEEQTIVLVIKAHNFFIYNEYRHISQTHSS